MLLTVTEEYRTWRGLLSSHDASLVAYPGLTIQPFQDFHRRPRSGVGSSRSVCNWNRTVLSPATFLRCLKLRICYRHKSGSRGRKAGSGHCGRTAKRRLNRGQAQLAPLVPASGWLREPTVIRRDQPAKASVVRSRCPLARGDWAKIIGIPSSATACLNWLGPTGKPDPGVCLNTAWQSV